MFPELAAWHWFALGTAMVVAIPLTYISDWRVRWREYRKRAAARRTSSTRAGTNPMTGIPELERCREELAEYIIAATKQRMVDGEHMAASIRFLPHLLELCEILDSQEIPHPKVKLGLVVLNGGEWGRYFANLWAVRHDIERARRVYQGEGSHP